MDTQRLILIGLAVVQLALWLVLAGRYKTPAAAPGAVVVHYGWKLRFLGLCNAFAFPMLMIIVLAMTPARYAPRTLPIGITLLALGCVGGALLAETQGVYLILTDATIAGVSPWRRRREWRWEEIERVTYSQLNRWLILHGPRHETIRAAFAVAGIRELAQAILKHVSGTKLAAARKVVGRLARL
jgi:hypothetical protein